MHDHEGADQGHGDRRRRNQGRAQAPEKGPDHQHHQHHGNHQRQLRFVKRRADHRGTVHHHGQFGIRRQELAQLGQPGMDVVDGFDNVGAGAPVDVENHRGPVIVEAAAVAVLHRVSHRGDIPQAHHGTVCVPDHQCPVFRRTAQWVGDLYLPALRPLFNHPQGAQGVTAGNRTPHIVQRDAVVQQGPGLQLHPHRRQGRAIHRHLPHPGDLCQLLGQDGRAGVVEFTGGEVRRTQGQTHDRRLGRINLAILRVAGHPRGQLAAHRVDRRLHLPRRRVDIAVHFKHQRHLGRALTAGGGQRGHPGNTAQRALQGGGHGAGHAFGAGTR